MLNEFSQIVDDWIIQINKTTKKAQAAVKPYIIPDEIAQERYNAKIGEVLYDFNVTMSVDIIAHFEQEELSWLPGESPIEKLLGHLSHLRVALLHDNGKVIFRRDNRNVWFRSWDFKIDQDFKQYIQLCRAQQNINWDNASFYINPFDRIFYISDDYEREPKNCYCVVPFDENISLFQLKVIGKSFKKDFPKSMIPEKRKTAIAISIKTDEDGNHYIDIQ